MPENKISIKEYIDILHASLKDYIDTRFESIQEAIRVATNALERRLENVNEWRASFRDLSSTYPTKAELSVFKESVDKDLREIRDWKNKQEGKASQSSVNISLILGVSGLVIGLISILLRFIGM